MRFHDIKFTNSIYAQNESYKNHCSPFKIKICQIFIFLFIFNFIILTISFSIIFKNKDEFRNSNFYLFKPKCTKDFTIIIHSSNQTKWRLDKFLRLYSARNRNNNLKHVHFLVIYGKNATPHPDYPYLIASDCNDTRSDLHCKNTFVYDHFVEHEDLGDFLYRAMDDTYLNIANLVKLVDQLRSIYDPYRHLVFRAFAVDEREDGWIFLGGGSGWLMSRALVSLHQIPEYNLMNNYKRAMYGQDDTDETIVIRRIGFKSLDVWDDPRWAESGCTTVLEMCPNNTELTPIEEMIAMHSIDEEQKEKWIHAVELPKYVYGYRVERSQCVRMCRGRKGIVNERTKMKYLRKNAEYITLSELMERKKDGIQFYENYLTRD